MTDWWNSATESLQAAAFGVWGESVTLHRAGLADTVLVGIPRRLGEEIDPETQVPVRQDGLELDVRKEDLPGEEALPNDEWTVRGERYVAGAPLDDSEEVLRFALYRWRSR